MGFLVLVFLLLGIALYFGPTIVALARGKRNAAAIVVLNLLAGWTFVGWVIALVWAFTEDQQPVLVAQYHGYPPPYHPYPQHPPQYLPPPPAPPAPERAEHRD